jgi:hypothetical protein
MLWRTSSLLQRTQLQGLCVLPLCKELEHIAADGSLACSSSSRHVSVGGLHNEDRKMAHT